MPAAESLSLEGLAEWAARAGVSLARGYSKPLKVCKLLIIQDIRDNFAGSHDPNGSPWKPLGRERPAGGDKPLLDKGILRGSVTGGDVGHIEEISESRLVMGTNLDRAAIHQYGGVIRPVNAKMLSIPLTKEAARYTSPRRFPRPLGIVGRPGHSPLLVEETPGRGKKQRRAKSIFQYLLVPQVTIPARQFLGFGSKLTEKIGKVFADWIGGQL